MNRREFLTRLTGILPAALLAEEVFNWPTADVLHRYLNNDLYTTHVKSDSIIGDQQDFVLVDASANPVTVVLPVPADVKHGSILIKKIDGSPNPIQIICECDDNPQIIVPYGTIRLNANESKYYIMS